MSLKKFRAPSLIDKQEEVELMREREERKDEKRKIVVKKSSRKVSRNKKR